jgi:hypothetical protein
MSVTLSLNPELTQKIYAEAKRLGITPEDLLQRDIEMRWGSATIPTEKAREKELIAQISKGLSETFWVKLRELNTKRKQETLTEAEHIELRKLVVQMEQWGVQRITIASEIAGLRGVSLQQTVAELGLQPIPLETSAE